MFLFLWLAAGLSEAEGVCQEGTIIASGLNCEQKKLILDRHNHFRDDVAAGIFRRQPKAAYMLEMRWRDSLAVKAQKWAEGCVFQHEINGTDGGVIYAQSVAMAYSSTAKAPNLTSLIHSWMDEVQDYKGGTNINLDSGHYLQLVWAETSLVGCGLVSFESHGWFHNFLVCNYLPPGNWAGEPPYIKGDKDCKAYSYNNSLHYKYLCATGQEETVGPCKDQIVNLG